MDSPFDVAASRNRLERLYSRMLTTRSTFDSHWQELANFFVPRRVRFNSTDRNKGDKRNQNIINTTPGLAVGTLQSGMHAGLTSPARPWLRLTVPNQELARRADVRAWLKRVADDMLILFSQCNLYNVLPSVYGDMGLYGTAAAGFFRDDQDIVRAYHYPIGSYVIGHDERGKVSVFAREIELTVLQLVTRYGIMPDGRSIDWSRFSPTIKTMWDKGDYEEPVLIRWMVQPNPKADPNMLAAKFKPFASYTWEVGSAQPEFLEQSGFDTFPIFAPRWDVCGNDSYGTDCPGMKSLGDAKQLQAMERVGNKGLQKQVDPPMVGPASLRSQKTSTLPGEITYVDVREGMQSLRAAHEVNLNLQHLDVKMQAVEYRINRAFYADLFLMLATTDPYRGSAPPTAREIDERHEEKLLALGPVLERTNDELLDPLVDRTFRIMHDLGMVPPPPPELVGQPMKPEYISILSQAQKLTGVVAQDRLLTVIVPAAQVFPDATAKIKFGRLVDNYAEMLGVDPEAIRTDEEADAILSRQAQAAQAAAEAEQAKNIGQAVKAGSEAQMGRDTALDRIVGNAAQV